MMKPLLLMSSPIATRSGYGDHARDIARTLIKSGKYDVKLASLRWGNTPMDALDPANPDDVILIERLLKEPKLDRQPDIFISLTVPNEFQPIGKWNLGITAGIESTACSAPWIEGVNRMDMVIVPSQHAKTVFEQTSYIRKNKQTGQDGGELKCQVPIEVLFEGVDLDIFHYSKSVPISIREDLKQIKEKFVFLFVGHWLKGALGQDRKDVGMLVKVFLEKFKNKPNPPALILKTSGATFSILDRNEIIRKVREIKKTVKADTYPNIYVVHGDLTLDELNGLYNHPKVKAHVSFTKGEGFGRPLLEAAMSQKPVIASNWSGHVDFLHPEYTVLLPGELTNVHKSAARKDVLIEGSKWFTVNYQYAGDVLMDVWKNYGKYKTAAEKQTRYTRENFSYKAMEDKLIEIMEKNVPDIPQQASLRLPKLKKIEPDKPKEPLKMKMPKLKRIK